MFIFAYRNFLSLNIGPLYWSFSIGPKIQSAFKFLFMGLIACQQTIRILVASLSS